MSITSSLPTSKILPLEGSSSISHASPKQLPIKISLPTLSPPAMPRPTPLQELNFALLKLKKALDAKCTSEEEQAARKNLIAKCIEEVNEKIPKEKIDYSQETPYDVKKFSDFMDLCFKGIIDVSLETAHALYNFRKELNPPDPQQEKKPHGLDFGMCFGETVALIENPFSTDDKEIQRKGRFFEIAYKTSDALQDEEDLNEIGKNLLEHPDQYPMVIQRAAHILGLDYEKGKEANFIKDALHEKFRLPRSGLERFLGKIAKSVYMEMLHSIVDKCREINVKSKKISEIEIELLKINHPKEKELIKEKEKLSKEIEELNALVFSLHSEKSALEKIIEGAKKIKRDLGTVPEKILQRHTLQKGVTILESSIEELPEKLKNIPDKKGTFELSLNPAKGDMGHTVLISLDPPFFRDINDSCYLTGKKKIRTFNTMDELLTFLPLYLQTKYPDEFKSAELKRYEKIKPRNTPKAV